MKKALIAIGVDRAGHFPALRGAASGAEQVGEWGRAQGFETTVFSDAGGKVVGPEEIFDAISEIVESRTYSQLVVFFSGHGVLRAPDCELWLLSKVGKNPNHAINVNGSISLARQCGIEHVVIISDACRSLAGTLQVSMVDGYRIFPAHRSSGKAPEVDVFYAALPGDPALEVSADDADKRHYGLLTDCMLTALRGDIETVIETVKSADGVQKHVVASRPLKLHLEDAIPRAAEAVSVALFQRPDSRVESALPKFLATIDAGAANVNDATNLPRSSQTESDAERGSMQWYQEHILLPRRGRPLPRSALSLEMRRLLAVMDERQTDMQTGFHVSGGEIDYFCVITPTQHTWRETYGQAIEINGPEPATLFLRFLDGTSTLLSVMPGFIGTLIIERGRIVTLNYTPSAIRDPYNDYEQLGAELETRRSFVAVAARQGSFRLPEASTAWESARYLRFLKRLDPTLGIYAAYAYHQAGDLQGIQSVYKYMKADHQPIPFDVAMLALGGTDNESVVHDCMPGVPMLSQGWSLLGNLTETMPKQLLEAGRYLEPSLWTTFSGKGSAILERYFSRGFP